jgi:hypothetical protein
MHTSKIGESLVAFSTAMEINSGLLNVKAVLKKREMKK